MLYINESTLEDLSILRLSNYLGDGDVLVLNDTKVIPAFLKVSKGLSHVNVYLSKQVDSKRWAAYAKPGRKLKVGDELALADDFKFKVLEKNYDGKQILIEFEYSGEFFSLLEKYGQMPLPPYIEKLRKVTDEDKSVYQTVFAKHAGAVAAPTAGLHFTKQTLHHLQSKGVKLVFITLHVGSGTFLPVEVEDISQHKMHVEYCEISSDAADIINNAKIARKKVLAVGTTSLRALEACVGYDGRVKPFAGAVDIFIRPAYKFKVADMLLTNFHLPKTTLLMLVAAFGGYENIMRAYDHGIKSGYRFYSYGDCCLIKRL